MNPLLDALFFVPPYTRDIKWHSADYKCEKDKQNYKYDRHIKAHALAKRKRQQILNNVGRNCVDRRKRRKQCTTLPQGKER